MLRLEFLDGQLNLSVARPIMRYSYLNSHLQLLVVLPDDISTTVMNSCDRLDVYG